MYPRDGSGPAEDSPGTNAPEGGRRVRRYTAGATGKKLRVKKRAVLGKLNPVYLGVLFKKAWHPVMDGKKAPGDIAQSVLTRFQLFIGEAETIFGQLISPDRSSAITADMLSPRKYVAPFFEDPKKNIMKKLLELFRDLSF